MNSVPSMSYIKKSKLNDTNININIYLMNTKVHKYINAYQDVFYSTYFIPILFQQNLK